MSRLAALSVCVIGLVLVAYSPATAQCVTFAPNVSCSSRQASPFPWANSGAHKPAPGSLGSTPLPTLPSAAVDCKMVKPVDKEFSSAMPVKRPDPTVHYSGKVLQVSVCQPPAQ